MSVTHSAAKTHTVYLFDLLMIDTFSGCMRVVLETLCCDIKLHTAKWRAESEQSICYSDIYSEQHVKQTEHLHYSISTHQTGHVFTTEFQLISCFTLSLSAPLYHPYWNTQYISFIHINYKHESWPVRSGFNALCIINLEYFIILTLSSHDSVCMWGSGLLLGCRNPKIWSSFSHLLHLHNCFSV